MFKRALSVILALVMCVGILIAFPLTVSAKNIEIAETGALKTPSFSGYNVTSAGIKLTWKSIKGAAKYRIFINSANSWKKLVDTTANSYTYKAKVGRSYLFTIRCVSANGKQFTSSFNRNGWRIYCLAAPKITRLSSAPTGVNMTIGKVTGAARYRVFVKSGSSWKALGDTTTTSFTHKGAKVGTKYTYTVRCVSANAKFYISDYNRTGWSGTYNPGWNTLYKNFILNKSYMNLSTNAVPLFNKPFNTLYKDMILFTLRDLNHDYIPELIVDSGYQKGHIAFLYHFYTVRNGKVVYLDSFSLSDRNLFTTPVSGYYGFFTFGGDEGYHTARYISMNGNLLENQVVAYENVSDGKSQIDVKDQTLYEAMNKGVVYNPYFTRKYPLKSYSDSGIRSMGWSSFVKDFGF